MARKKKIEDELAEDAAENSVAEKTLGGKKSKVKKISIKKLLSGSFLEKEETLKHVPFMAFLVFLGIILIANSYWVERMAKEVSILKKEMKELSFEEPSTAAELVELKKQSEMARRLDSLGIKESVVPPIKIKVEKREK